VACSGAAPTKARLLDPFLHPFSGECEAKAADRLTRKIPVYEHNLICELSFRHCLQQPKVTLTAVYWRTRRTPLSVVLSRILVGIVAIEKHEIHLTPWCTICEYIATKSPYGSREGCDVIIAITLRSYTMIPFPNLSAAFCLGFPKRVVKQGQDDEER
jgi:hypothetical protein